MVVQIGEHQRGSVRLLLDSAPAKRRPHNEGHDLVRVPDERGEQPATEGHEGCSGERHAVNVVVRHHERARQREPRPGRNTSHIAEVTTNTRCRSAVRRR